MTSETAILLLGGFFIILGIFVRLGLWKNWYWRSRGGAYAYIPMGIVLMLYSYHDDIRQQGGNAYLLYLVVIGLFMVLTLYFSLRTPGWIKPAWVTWIETHPQHIVTKMKSAVVDGDKEWKHYVKDEESIDRWAKQFRSK